MLLPLGRLPRRPARRSLSLLLITLAAAPLPALLPLPAVPNNSVARHYVEAVRFGEAQVQEARQAWEPGSWAATIRLARALGSQRILSALKDSHGDSGIPRPAADPLAPELERLLARAYFLAGSSEERRQVRQLHRRAFTPSLFPEWSE
jgi:hypothetical protein